MAVPGKKLLDDSSLFVVALVSLLHLAWAALVIASPVAARSTPIAAVVAVTGSRGGAVAALAGTAVLALAVSWVQHSSRTPDVRPGTLALGLIPQQFFILASAAGGIGAAVVGHYADGVIRPWQFIIGDQLPVILIAFLYSTAIIVVDRPKK